MIKLPDTNVKAIETGINAVSKSVLAALEEASVDNSIASCGLVKAAASLCFAISKEGGGPGGSVGEGAYLLMEQFSRALNDLAGRTVMSFVKPRDEEEED